MENKAGFGKSYACNYSQLGVYIKKFSNSYFSEVSVIYRKTHLENPSLPPLDPSLGNY